MFSLYESTHLPENEDVGFNWVMLASQHLSCAPAACLHLICDQQGPVQCQQLLGSCHIAVVWHDNASLPLHSKNTELKTSSTSKFSSQIAPLCPLITVVL